MCMGFSDEEEEDTHPVDRGPCLSCEGVVIPTSL